MTAMSSAPEPVWETAGVARAAAVVPRGPAAPRIETARMVLRPLEAPDAGLLTLYSGDARVARATRSVPHPLPPGTSEAYIARANAAQRVEEVWALDASAQGLDALIGIISLRPLGNAQSEIAFWIAPAFWNTGYASEAVRALIEANPLRDSSYFAAVFQDNPASARVLTNAGFDYLGDAEAFSVARDAMVRTWTYIRRLAPPARRRDQDRRDQDRRD